MDSYPIYILFQFIRRSDPTGSPTYIKDSADEPTGSPSEVIDSEDARDARKHASDRRTRNLVRRAKHRSETRKTSDASRTNGVRRKLSNRLGQ